MCHVGFLLSIVFVLFSGHLRRLGVLSGRVKIGHKRINYRCSLLAKAGQDSDSDHYQQWVQHSAYAQGRSPKLMRTWCVVYVKGYGRFSVEDLTLRHYERAYSSTTFQQLDEQRDDVFKTSDNWFSTNEKHREVCTNLKDYVTMGICADHMISPEIGDQLKPFISTTELSPLMFSSKTTIISFMTQQSDFLTAVFGAGGSTVHKISLWNG